VSRLGDRLPLATATLPRYAEHHHENNVDAAAARTFIDQELDTELLQANIRG
jgi:hypothetical protein